MVEIYRTLFINAMQFKFVFIISLIIQKKLKMFILMKEIVFRVYNLKKKHIPFVNNFFLNLNKVFQNIWKFLFYNIFHLYVYFSLLSTCICSFYHLPCRLRSSNFGFLHMYCHLLKCFLLFSLQFLTNKGKWDPIIDKFK